MSVFFTSRIKWAVSLGSHGVVQSNPVFFPRKVAGQAALRHCIHLGLDSAYSCSIRTSEKIPVIRQSRTCSRFFLRWSTWRVLRSGDPHASRDHNRRLPSLPQRQSDYWSKVTGNNSCAADRCINMENRNNLFNLCDFIITPAVMIPPLYVQPFALACRQSIPYRGDIPDLRWRGDHLSLAGGNKRKQC